MRMNELFESVDFMPGERHGDHIGFPSSGVRHVTSECPDCNGTGEEDYTNGRFPCMYCNGTGKNEDTEYMFPSMNVSNRNAEVIADMIGVESVDSSGWIPNENLPEIRRTLIRIINGSTAQHQIEPSTVGGGTIMDRDGPIPQIRKTAKIYDFGVSDYQLKAYAERLLGIIDWAQKNKCGVYWA